MVLGITPGYAQGPSSARNQNRTPAWKADALSVELFLQPLTELELHVGTESLGFGTGQSDSQYSKVTPGSMLEVPCKAKDQPMPPTYKASS